MKKNINERQVLIDLLLSMGIPQVREDEDPNLTSTGNQRPLN